MVDKIKKIMSQEGTILVVDDNKSILAALPLLLKRIFKNVITISSPNTLTTKLREESIDVVLLDMNFSAGINSGNEGLYWLSEIRKVDTEIPVILFTAYADIDLAVRAIKEGATDFVVKPWDNSKLIAVLQNAYNLRKSRRELKHIKELKRELTDEPQMYWGKSPAMRELQKLITRVAKTDANILITGENGTGKEMLAREIHRLSNRHDNLLVPVDMGAITESLFESELFGHIKGAFTDARVDRAGKFEVANNGTLFLDEIGNLSYHLQAKLLTAIQSRSIVRVGSNQPIGVDIRLVCATNRNIDQMVAGGDFREDLLYRINTIHIVIPPLRERPEDIMPLATIFISKYAAKYGKGNISIEPEAEKRLTAYPWYGNIRELQHTIEKAVIMCDGRSLGPDDFLFSRTPSEPSAATQSAHTTLEDMEMTMIRQAMDKHEGNLSAVAAQLGITRQTLYNKLKKFDI